MVDALTPARHTEALEALLARPTVLRPHALVAGPAGALLTGLSGGAVLVDQAAGADHAAFVDALASVWTVGVDRAVDCGSAPPAIAELADGAVRVDPAAGNWPTDAPLAGEIDRAFVVEAALRRGDAGVVETLAAARTVLVGPATTLDADARDAEQARRAVLIGVAAEVDALLLQALHAVGAVLIDVALARGSASAVDAHLPGVAVGGVHAGDALTVYAATVSAGLIIRAALHAQVQFGVAALLGRALVVLAASVLALA